MAEKIDEKLDISVSQDTDEDVEVSMTPSADDILGVSPVSSFEARMMRQSPPPSVRLPPRRPPMTPPPPEKETSQDEVKTPEASPTRRYRTTITTNTEEAETTPTRRSTLSEEAFSSSSEEDDDEASIKKDALAAYDEKMSSKEANTASLSSRARSSAPTQSEFDRAVITGDGVPNKGSASFDVAKDGDFLSQAEHSVIHEAMSMDESYVESPERSQARVAATTKDTTATISYYQ